MSIKGIAQPEYIQISETLRLKYAHEEIWDEAIPWYQNPLIMYYSEGVKDKIYDKEVIQRMYRFLSGIGELYFIQIKEGESFKSIGDVTLSSENLPIVIGDEAYWGKGIGKKVIQTLISRAKEIGIKEIMIEIYTYNKRSQRLFESFGFIRIGQVDETYLYQLKVGDVPHENC